MKELEDKRNQEMETNRGKKLREEAKVNGNINHREQQDDVAAIQEELVQIEIDNICNKIFESYIEP